MTTNMLKRISLILLIVMVAACSRKPTLNEHKLYVFGTVVSLSIWDADPEKEQQAVAEISKDFQNMHYEWHAWEPGPLVDVNNAFAKGEGIKPIDSLVPLIKESIRLSSMSNGLFNPTIGKLLNLWGFQSSERPNHAPPSKEVLNKWLKDAPSVDDLYFKEGLLYSRNRNVSLDFGAFAKGYGVDLAIDKLRSYGINNAIVNAGGDLRVIGSKNGDPWRVGVRHPQNNGSILAAIESKGDESIYTSGNYERYNEYKGVRYTHILDPRTAMPVNGITSVTVIDQDGGLADAAATALVVAGVKEWHQIAKRMGIKYVMLVDDNYTIYMNPAMQKRVKFKSEPAQIVISDPL